MNHRRQVLAAYRKVLRWLHQNHLQPGDRLPSQLQFGKTLGICQGTLSAAMTLLVEDTVLSRKQKSGTVLVNLSPQNPHRRIWTAGIVMPEFGASGYFAALTVQLHRELAARNFADRTYFISPQSLPASEVDIRKPADFSGLENDLEDGLVDALITSTRLDCDDVPCVTLGDYPHARCRIGLDDAGMLRRSLTELNARGIRKTFVAGFSREQNVLLHQHASELGTGHSVERLNLSATTEWAGVALAEQFVKQCGADERFGVIIKDDLIAAVFAREISAKNVVNPIVCLQTYRGSFLSYPVPTLEFMIDLKVLGRTAVDLVTNRLLGIAGSESFSPVFFDFRDTSGEVIEKR